MGTLACVVCPAHRREAAPVALSIYTRAVELFECRLKLELCVPALLIHAGYRVAHLFYGAAIVRSQAYCDDAGASKALATNPKMRCGRHYLSHPQPWPACDAHAPVAYYNLSENVDFWGGSRLREREERRAAGEASTKAERKDQKKAQRTDEKAQRRDERKANV